MINKFVITRHLDAKLVHDLLVQKLNKTHLIINVASSSLPASLTLL